MNNLSIDLVVNLNQVLTPASFSAILVQLIKYVAYNSKSIPYSYEGFSHLVTRKRYLLSKGNNDEPQHSYNDLMANNFFFKISEAYDNYEATFKFLREEIKSPDRLKQVVILFGNTVVNPRCLYRIQKPYLCVENSENTAPIRKHLETTLRTLLQSTHLNSLFESCREPTNLFILIELTAGYCPKSEWFMPFDNFSLCSTKKEFNIVLETSMESGSSQDSLRNELNSVNEQDSSSGSPSKERECCSNWFRCKEPLKGFKNIKIAGKSIENYLLKS